MKIIKVQEPPKLLRTTRPWTGSKPALQFPASIETVTPKCDGTLCVRLVTGSEWRVWRLRGELRKRKLS